MGIWKVHSRGYIIIRGWKKRRRIGLNKYVHLNMNGYMKCTFKRMNWCTDHENNADLSKESD